jgi:hypothetical protein
MRITVRVTPPVSTDIITTEMDFADIATPTVPSVRGVEITTVNNVIVLQSPRSSIIQVLVMASAVTPQIFATNAKVIAIQMPTVTDPSDVSREII